MSRFVVLVGLLGIGACASPNQRASTTFVAPDGSEVTCVQPPPDVMASERRLGIDAQIDSVIGIVRSGLSTGTKYERIRAETAGVQAIEILEYRMCVAYTNGLLDRESYQEFLREILPLLPGVQRRDTITTHEEQAPSNTNPADDAAGSAGSMRRKTSALFSPTAIAADIILNPRFLRDAFTDVPILVAAVYGEEDVIQTTVGVLRLWSLFWGVSGGLSTAFRVGPVPMYLAVTGAVGYQDGETYAGTEWIATPDGIREEPVYEFVREPAVGAVLTTGFLLPLARTVSLSLGASVVGTSGRAGAGFSGLSMGLRVTPVPADTAVRH